MEKTGKHLPLIAASAIAASTIGMFTAAVPAQAETCEYEFPTILQVKTPAGIEPDGWTYQIPVSGSPRRTVGPGKAMGAVIGFQEGSFGTPYGGMNGNSINFTINFDSGPAKGSTTAFRGQIDPDGFASGTIASTGTPWRSSEKMSCVYKPPVVEAPKPAQPAPSADHMFQLTADRDRYKRPGGKDEDKLPGFVDGAPDGPQVNLIGCQKDNWCQIAVPPDNQFVWVWGDAVPPEVRF
ncbi:hypothetical protein [Mycolicibacterium stellerae]|uniref:hypothetical protein n=1 Tax=Mycolicibacterium stellerae TaxID=2358193 RepID=UPI000F0BBC8E|nr:hypothetical protein [Mycolicibacterium stellerae]